MTESLYIIDGHSQIFAAYYAPLSGNLTAPSGEPTKATYIFTTMLLKLLRERRPDLLVVAMDSPEPSFRHALYAQYKANRPAMPEDLAPQIARIAEILQAMNVPTIRLPGFEADDIIGTLTRLAGEAGYQSFMCSKDKDLQQLLDAGTVLYDPRSDEVLDLQGLQEKKGLLPHQVADALALQGDTSDNIPGVPDVGPKTAQQWIQKYGSLGELVAHADEIGGKRGKSLRDNLDQLRLSRRLVEIDRDVPVEPDWQAYRDRRPDRDALERLFRQLGFTRLLDQLDEIAPAAGDTDSDTRSPTAPAPAVEAEYVLIDTPEAFEDFLAQLRQQRIFAIDTETTALNPVAANLVGMSFAWEAGRAYYLPVRAPLGQRCLDQRLALDALAPILADPEIAKVGQNIKYDLTVLRRAGVELAGVQFDTMVASYLANPERSRHNLDSLALDHLHHETIKISALLGKGKGALTFDQVDTGIAADYAAEDADITWRLYGLLVEPIEEEERLSTLFHDVEMPLVEVLAQMEQHGVAVDVSALRKLESRLADRLEELTEEIYTEAGCTFNIDSPKQLSEVLFDRLELPVQRKTKSGRSTDQAVLEALAWQHPVPRLMLEYRQLSKLKSTYVSKLPGLIYPATGRIHASFNQTITATGRLSSSDPNLQNIPVRSELGQEIRRAFVPGEAGHCLLAADYSQIELRLMAQLSGDENLRNAFAAGSDIHRYVAAQVFGVGLDEVDADQRRKAKAVNFGIIYGQTPFGLSRSIGVSVEEAAAFIKDYFGRYPDITRFIESTIESARKNGYVETLLGRRRPLPNIASANRNVRELAQRMAVNTVVQGSAADVIKVAMVNLYRRIQREGLGLRMILQVHDELVFELPTDQAQEMTQLVRHEMEHAIDLDVPLLVDVATGPDWLACK